MQIIITLYNELQLTYIPWFNNQNLARRSPINFYIFIELCTKTHHDRIYGNQKISTYKSKIWKWFSTKQKKKIDELKIFNLHTTFKSKTKLIFIMYLIVISKYETQDIFCKHCIKEDKCKVLATENDTNKAKSKILILPAT